MQGGAGIRRPGIVALAAGIGILALLLVTTARFPATPATANTTTAAMFLSVSPPGGCDQNPAPTACTIGVGTTFTLTVNVESLPGGPYAAFQTDLFYDSLIYKPVDPGDEIVWPQSASPIRYPVAPNGDEGTVYHADVSALQTPLVASTHTGAVLQVQLTCSPQPQQFTVALLPYSETQLLGSGFVLVDQSGQFGPTVPAKSIGQRTLDLDGNAKTLPTNVDVAAALTIGCGVAVATATPTSPPVATATNTATRTSTAAPGVTPTATRTPTRTPTSPPGQPGDTNCDGDVDSVDAALVLQKDAALIATVACPQDADANHDGNINSIDASIILQFIAGLLGQIA